MRTPSVRRPPARVPRRILHRAQPRGPTGIVDEPSLTGAPRVDAYLAAAAAHLAWRAGLDVPHWTGGKARFLERPFHPCGLESLKATLLVESPTAFRRRMIFVGADPLYRPRRESAGIGRSSRGTMAMLHLAKDDILRGFRKLDAVARRHDVLVDLPVYGGAAMAIAFGVRRATRDVDAVVHGAPDFLRMAAVEVAAEEGWPEDWLNDGVKGFLSGNEEMRLMEMFAAADGIGLRIHVPSPQYMFAMKSMAIPEGVDGSHDISDIEALARLADITDLASALDLVGSFYPRHRIPPKVRFGLEEIMERVAGARTVPER